MELGHLESVLTNIGKFFGPLRHIDSSCWEIVTPLIYPDGERIRVQLGRSPSGRLTLSDNGAVRLRLRRLGAGRHLAWSDFGVAFEQAALETLNARNCTRAARGELLSTIEADEVSQALLVQQVVRLAQSAGEIVRLAAILKPSNNGPTP